jgi:ubiquinone/menaquinone biosynthesis C-methylase UbiE
LDFRRYYAIVEAMHTIQNPTSPQKMDRLIDALHLTNESNVLDIGCGKGWLLNRMAERHGIRGTGIEINPWFCEAARMHPHIARAGDRITIIESDARHVMLADNYYDAAVCIGASFALGDIATCLTTLRRVVQPGGLIAVGDIYRHDTVHQSAQWRDVPTLAQLVELVRGDGEALELITASVDEWDYYYAQQWRAAAQWKLQHRDDPEYDSFCTRADEGRTFYLNDERPYIGWSVIVATNGAPHTTQGVA